ncbi:MAG: D-alanyl-D-alanine carboxypeptidase [Bacillus sp. (in: Bacteria)]|nr:D-alanyl-D-alanine carboxypeptidase [Bacillus sp. (in: firmicutes)]MCM1425368.1 D-alanyl-D-alanine carboxypeptidase [Eubacterium sp.]
MYFIKKKKTISLCFLTVFLITYLFHSYELTAYATLEELAAEAEARKLLPIQSNEIENWPTGPQISAQSAILMEANTGVILYEKNIHEKLYPASTTKILTSLIAMENGDLDDMVSFSHEAVFTVPVGGSNMGMDVGESITLEECLYGIMVASANEVANAAAEYVSGTIDDFIILMNKRAEELGCTDSHFTNTNGLPDADHYTSAYDLALISKAFFQNEMLCKIGNTARYHFEPTATQPDDFYEKNKHQLITGEISYNGILGGKTGYTDEARQTLVTCAEQNGMKLICVVLKEESPNQFSDTIELFDYGFQNFQVLNVADNEAKFNIDNIHFFQADNDIFGSSKPILSIDAGSYVIVPNMADFSDLDSTINYEMTQDNHVAEINYTYNGTYVGSAYVNLAEYTESTYEFNTEPQAADITTEKTDTSTDEDNTIFINIKKALIGILIAGTIIICIFIIHALINNRNNARRRKNRVNRKNYRKERVRSNFDDFDF